jgi:twitching motility protein PilT
MVSPMSASNINNLSVPHEWLAVLVSRMLESNASDLHLQQDHPPYLRIIGGLHPQSDLGPLDADKIEELVQELLEEPAINILDERGAVDISAILGGLRFRINVFRHDGGLALSMRRIPDDPPGFQELNLPAVVKRLANLPRGLVIVCGPTGSGKSTTLAAVINHINSTRRVHIITIENPIEFVHKSKTGLVVQREIGKHCESFSGALRDALREDPDVIAVGEMRDLETIELALRAAETGHLVFSTLHTFGAAGSLSRIVDAFDPGTRSTIRVQLSLVLMSVVSQVLLPTKDGKGRIPACEVLMVNDAARHMIRTNKLEQIPNLIQAGGTEGMISFPASITELAKSGVIDTAAGLESIGEGWRIADMLFEG